MTSAFPPPAGNASTARAVSTETTVNYGLGLIAPQLGDVQRAVLELLDRDRISHTAACIAEETKRARTAVTRALLRMETLELVESVQLTQWQITQDGRAVAEILRATP